MTSEIKLSIKICNERPVELNQLTISLNALAKEYDLFCNKQLNLAKNERRLEIVKLEKGSLLVEMVPVAMSVIQEVNPVLAFTKYLVDTLSFFTGKSEQAPANSFTSKNCDNLTNFLSQTANDNGSRLVINAANNSGTTHIGATLDSLMSNAAQNQISLYKAQLAEGAPLIKHKEAFYWAVASFAEVKSDQDKGVIEKLDKKPHKVIFENETDKMFMTQFNPHYRKDWQNLVYIVDVEAIKIQDVIKTYKILRVYDEDTIDPDEDETIN